MLELEDLPRMESLSPIKEIEEYQQTCCFDDTRSQGLPAMWSGSGVSNGRSSSRVTKGGGYVGNRRYISQESEIVEVLWKQDVDLGYSLTPAHLLGSDDANDGGVGAGAAANAKHSSSVTDDDIEKLKALEELKLENPKFDSKDEGNEGEELGNEWDGIPFTIDNETVVYFYVIQKCRMVGVRMSYKISRVLS